MLQLGIYRLQLPAHYLVVGKVAQTVHHHHGAGATQVGQDLKGQQQGLIPHGSLGDVGGKEGDQFYEPCLKMDDLQGSIKHTTKNQSWWLER